MTLTNRVTPAGEIAALAYRGLFMGNRGVLHDDERTVRIPWAHPNWIVCVTERGDVRRTLMAPGWYTELFFLDEVHALAAGHRPCAECRRAAYRAFLGPSGHDGAAALDTALHAERLTGAKGARRASRVQRQHALPVSALPDGAMALVGGTAVARTADGFIAWSREAPGGWLASLDGVTEDADALRHTAEADAPLDVLTPPTTLRALRRGYAPVWHPSAERAARV